MKKSNYSHIIWDWNGTLIDDAELCVYLVNSLLDSYGLNKVNLEFYRKNFRFPVSSYYSLLGLPSDPLNFQNISNNFIMNYCKLFQNCNLQTGVIKSLTKLRNAGIKSSILSASRQSDLNLFVSFFNLEHLFDFITGVNDTLAKGKTEVSINHFNKIGVCSSKILLIGDTLHDWEVARKLGIDSLLYDGGHNSSTLLSEANVPIIQSILEVCEHVLD